MNTNVRLVLRAVESDDLINLFDSFVGHCLADNASERLHGLWAHDAQW